MIIHNMFYWAFRVSAFWHMWRFQMGVGGRFQHCILFSNDTTWILCHACKYCIVHRCANVLQIPNCCPSQNSSFPTCPPGALGVRMLMFTCRVRPPLTYSRIPRHLISHFRCLLTLFFFFWFVFSLPGRNDLFVQVLSLGLLAWWHLPASRSQISLCFAAPLVLKLRNIVRIRVSPYTSSFFFNVISGI